VDKCVQNAYRMYQMTHNFPKHPGPGPAVPIPLSSKEHEATGGDGMGRVGTGGTHI